MRSGPGASSRARWKGAALTRPKGERVWALLKLLRIGTVGDELRTKPCTQPAMCMDIHAGLSA